MSRLARFLVFAALAGAVAGGAWLWNYVDDMTEPVLSPINPSYAGSSSVPRKAAGLQLEHFSFKGWDGGEVPAVIVTKSPRNAEGEDDSTSRQLAVTAELAARSADRLDSIDYVLLSVDWDHGIRSALPLAESLTAAGLRCVLWEPRGADDRRPYCTHGLRECRDVPALIDALTQRDGGEKPVVVGVGQGYGAALLLQAAAREPRLRGIVSIDAFASLRGSLERTMPTSSLVTPLTVWLMDRKISSEVGFECFDVAPAESAANIDRNVPALVINLAQDNPVATLDDAVTIYRQLPSDNREIWTLRTAEDAPQATEREFTVHSGTAEKRRTETIRVSLVGDEDAAVADMLHWLNDCVVDAVETPQVLAPDRPVLSAGTEL